MGKGCAQIRPLLSAYMDEAAEPEETRAVENHLQSCADCREILSQLHKMCLLLRNLENPGVNRCIWQDIKDRIN